MHMTLNWCFTRVLIDAIGFNRCFIISSFNWATLQPFFKKHGNRGYYHFKLCLHDFVKKILIPKRAQNASSNVFCNIRQSSLFNIKMFIIMFSMIYQLNRVSRDTVSPPQNSNICHCEYALLVIADCFPCKLFQNSFIYFTEKEHWLTFLHSF